MHFAGDVTGAMDIQGTISSTGYRYTTVPSDPSKLDADDLLQGGSAVLIEGDVTGGIVFAIPPANNNASNNDEDGDGIEDAKEGTAKITSFGAAPAVVIGATGRDIAIGALPATASGFGIIIDGSITGTGVYAGVDGNGMLIGGRGGDGGAARAAACAHAPHDAMGSDRGDARIGGVTSQSISCANTAKVPVARMKVRKIESLRPIQLCTTHQRDRPFFTRT